jgi:hypothetical protein
MGKVVEGSESGIQQRWNEGVVEGVAQRSAHTVKVVGWSWVAQPTKSRGC